MYRHTYIMLLHYWQYIYKEPSLTNFLVTDTVNYVIY